MKAQLKDLMPRTPLKLLQSRSIRNSSISDTDNSAETNSNQTNSRLLDLITENTTSDTNIDENNGGDDDRHVMTTCDDNQRKSFLHSTFKRLYSHNSESSQAMQMVPLCHNAHRTEKHRRYSEAECLT